MVLDAVVAEIREKGQKEADRIQSEAQKEVQKILSAAQVEVEAIKLAAEEEVERQVAHIDRQEVGAANLAVKRVLLNAQKDLIDEVFSATVGAIANLPGDFHKKAIRELLKRVAKEIEEGVVYCNERDIPALEDALSTLKTLKGFSFGGKVDIEGGIIAENRDGGLQLDYSYETILTEVWESGLKDASEILFG